jgi:hypothetical protein
MDILPFRSDPGCTEPGREVGESSVKRALLLDGRQRSWKVARREPDAGEVVLGGLLVGIPKYQRRQVDWSWSNLIVVDKEPAARQGGGKLGELVAVTGSMP